MGASLDWNALADYVQVVLDEKLEWVGWNAFFYIDNFWLVAPWGLLPLSRDLFFLSW